MKVIIALNYQHCEVACRELGLSPRDREVALVRTCDAQSVHRLRGLKIKRDDVVIYETAWDGEHMGLVLDTLNYCYVD